MKSIAILQSSYIPWKGYFDMINSVDEFVLYDDCQYTRRDWRNRNKIKTANGTVWLTIPVKVKERFHQRICDTEVDNHAWCQKHLASIRHQYCRTPYFKEIFPFVETMYGRSQEMALLSDINKMFIEELCRLLEIDTLITQSMDYSLESEKPNNRLIELCTKAGAHTYLSGPAAKSYLDESLFEESGIAVCWMDYSQYEEYTQLYPPFTHHVTVLDLLFHCGLEGSQSHVKKYSLGKDIGVSENETRCSSGQNV